MHNGKILIYFYGNMYICLLVIKIFQKCLYVTSHYVSASLHCNEKDHKQSAHQLTDVNEFCLKKFYAYCTMLIYLKRFIENKKILFPWSR